MTEKLTNVKEADKLLNAREVASMLNICVTTIYAHMKKGNFPQPVQILNSTRWKLSDIEEYINSQPRGVRTQ
ncbi:helix-turn-helix transcriptional regulator [Bartonella sp. DGB1]|uniref:helix-turn-helix transcriptional regulator n=1 Tax=Bartonella sp. DGB1 TaxID=3239807 RepID=UPI0035260B63